MKPCIRCNETKPLSEFYTHPMMGDGHLNKCKGCCREYARRRHYRKMQDPKWRESERERSREKFRRRGGEWATSEAAKTPEGVAAYNATARKLPAAPSGMERHHWSYNREDHLDVICIRVSYHRALHRHMEYDAETRYFRTPNGHLLDTRRKHLRWAFAVWNDRARVQEEALAA